MDIAWSLVVYMPVLRFPLGWGSNRIRGGLFKVVEWGGGGRYKLVSS